MTNDRNEFNILRHYYQDNLKYECANCDCQHDLQLHHIVPLAIGGTNKLSNVVYLCEECHGIMHKINFNKHSKLTKEGIKKAKMEGKQIGQLKGTKLTTKKSIEAKEQIIKHCKDFEGTLKDIDVMKITGLARNTYYKYKKELEKVKKR